LTGSAAAALAAAIVGNTGSVLAQAGQPLVARWILNYEFAFDPRTIDQALAQPATGLRPGPLYVAGPIYDEGSLGPDGTPGANAVVVGTHRFFGWVYEPASTGVIGTHTFDIIGRGKIVLNTSSDGLAGIVSGGTGEFKFARGEMRAAIISAQNMAFRVTTLLDPGTVGM